MSQRWWYLWTGLALTASAASAQRSYESIKGAGVEANPTYDGRYAFARLKYQGDGCVTDEGPGWHHDYPVADRNLMRMTTTITRFNARVDSSLVLAPDDPELMKYPIAYLSEPGCWMLSDSEVKALRAYLTKGGLLILDDFFGGNQDQYVTQLRRVLPERRLLTLDDAKSVSAFELLFKVGPKPLDHGQFIGIFEDDDPAKRLMVVGYVSDLGNFWQWSGPGQAVNNSYKVGVNLVLYGMTH